MKNIYFKHLFTALLLLCATAVVAHDFEVGGIYYNITSTTDFTVGVTYRGNYSSQYSNEYTGSVVIPESVIYNGSTYSVTSIGDGAFGDCSGLTSIEIPNSVTSIGSSAFLDCSGLMSIEIPNSVTSFGINVFFGCRSLVLLVVGNKFLGEIPLRDSYNLKYVVWISSEEEMTAEITWDESYFQERILLGDLVIPENITCNGKSYTVTSIGSGVFAGAELRSVEIPNSVTSIGDRAFSGCAVLESVEIPSSVTSIGSDAFNGTAWYDAWYDNQQNGVAYLGKVLYEYIGVMPENTSIKILEGTTGIAGGAFSGCSGLTNITSLIPAENLFKMYNVFYRLNFTACTLYVPYGAKETYASTWGWGSFDNIVELEPTATEVTVTIGQYGCATYCSPYALDFTQVEGLKAYAATGYNKATQVVTLTRVQTAEAGLGLFLKGEPGEYVVPVIEYSNDYTLNLLVGTLEQTTVNSTAGEMSNYKFTIAEGDAAPMFYPFEDNTTLSAGKAYLQIPTAWLPATAQKSLNIRFDEGETTDIDELKGESGEVKTIYDLQGRVVENPTSGIYIINGKKVIIK